MWTTVVKSWLSSKPEWYGMWKQRFALSTSYIRACAWSVYSCCQGILVHRQCLSIKDILNQCDACAPRRKNAEECLSKGSATLACTIYLRRDLPGDKTPWKFIAYLEQHATKQVLWWWAFLENPKIGRFLKHNVYVSQGILLVLFCSLTAVVK